MGSSKGTEYYSSILESYTGTKGTDIHFGFVLLPKSDLFWTSIAPRYFQTLSEIFGVEYDSENIKNNFDVKKFPTNPRKLKSFGFQDCVFDAGIRVEDIAASNKLKHMLFTQMCPVLDIVCAAQTVSKEAGDLLLNSFDILFVAKYFAKGAVKYNFVMSSLCPSDGANMSLFTWAEYIQECFRSTLEDWEEWQRFKDCSDAVSHYSPVNPGYDQVFCMTIRKIILNKI